MDTKLFPALRAFIICNDKVLIIRESSRYKGSPNHGKYDLPGGKIRPNERFDAALRREVKEETGLEIDLGKAFSISEWRPEINGVRLHIVATFIECTTDTADVVLGQDHDDYIWINLQDFQKYDILETLLPAFKDFLTKQKRG